MFPKAPEKPHVPRRRVKDPAKDPSYMGDQKYGDYRPAKYSARERVVVMPWNTEEGRERLTRSKYNHAFFHLAHTYQPQKNPFYCGVAAMVITLNALRLDEGRVPSQPEFHYHHFDAETGELRRFPYRMYSQLTLLDEETDRIKPRSRIAPRDADPATHQGVFDPGLNLRQVREILDLYQTGVEEVRAMDDVETGMALFRDHLMQTLVKDEKIIIVNFDGDTLGMAIGGHFAVVGAFDKETDAVLLLDPAAHKTAWYWAPLNHLYYAMNTLDKGAAEHAKRGYLIVWDRAAGGVAVG